jgi:hypothetical protein
MSIVPPRNVLELHKELVKANARAPQVSGLDCLAVGCSGKGACTPVIGRCSRAAWSSPIAY